MIGIYKITNNLNGKIYIGQSNDIQRRFSEHCYKGSSSRIPLDEDIQKYGKENFTFDIIEECSIEKLNERETYWIVYFNSIENGYNCNLGGQTKLIGENNPRAKLTEKEVMFIRQCYNQHKKQKEIYEKFFSKKLTFQSFQNLWQGRSWNYIMPEVFTEENKKYYILQNSIGSNGAGATLTDNEVMAARTRYINESAKSIYEDYKNKMKFQTFQAMLWGRSYTNLPIYSKKQKKWINS